MQASNPDAGSAGRRMLAIALLRRPLMYELAVDGSKEGSFRRILRDLRTSA